jgi:hypothetical protein
MHDGVKPFEAKQNEQHHISKAVEPYMASAITAASKILLRRRFFYLIYVNHAYLVLAKSFVCNMKHVNETILWNTIFFTDHQHTTNVLEDFEERLLVFTVPYAAHRAVSFGTLEYYWLTLQRLEIQNALLQQGGCLMVIEADATWFSPDVDAEIERLLEYHELISGDNYRVDPMQKQISAGFSGFCGNSNLLRLFDLYTDTYRDQLTQIGDRVGLEDEGEQILLTHMIRHHNISVFWLDPCTYATGVWYEKEDYSVACPFPKVLQNNYIIGNQAKVDRAKKWGHWFLDQDGQQCREGKLHVRL